MASLYRRRTCRTCRGGRLKECEAAEHDVVTLRTWWVKYRDRGGRIKFKSTEETNKEKAKLKLAGIVTTVAKGISVPSKLERFTISDAAEILFTDYSVNGKRSLVDLKRRVEKHLLPYFGERRLMTTIAPDDISAFQKHRQQQGASNGEINRELTALKRMFTLAVRARKLNLAARPYIELLDENNVRTGFFEVEQFESVRSHLEPHFQGIVTFAYITGWRTPSEILPLEWRQVDFNAREVRLDAGSTKNGEGRVFPFTRALEEVLDGQRRLAEGLKEKGIIKRYVFFYPTETKDGKAGKKCGKRITESGFYKAWKKAREAAGCPGRIPHDFRRTTVRRLEQAGIPRSVAMKLTGHKTEAVYRRYAIVSDGDLRAAAKRLDGYNNGYTEGNAATSRDRTA